MTIINIVGIFLDFPRERCLNLEFEVYISSSSPWGSSHTLKYWCQWRVLITNGRLSLNIAFFRSSSTTASLECVTRNA